jgi:hypothetical protein
MFVLTRSITILDGLTRLACLETDAPLLATLGATVGRCHITFLSPLYDRGVEEKKLRRRESRQTPQRYGRGKKVTNFLCCTIT